MLGTVFAAAFGLQLYVAPYGPWTGIGDGELIAETGPSTRDPTRFGTASTRA